MTADILTSVLAAILSLLASYFPGFSDWYASQEPTYKRLYMAFGNCRFRYYLCRLCRQDYGDHYL
jgi:hypothetical protein